MTIRQLGSIRPSPIFSIIFIHVTQVARSRLPQFQASPSNIFWDIPSVIFATLQYKAIFDDEVGIGDDFSQLCLRLADSVFRCNSSSDVPKMSGKSWQTHQYHVFSILLIYQLPAIGIRLKKLTFTCGSYRAETKWVSSWHQLDTSGHEIYLSRHL